MWMTEDVSRGGHSLPLRNAGASRNNWSSAEDDEKSAAAKMKNARQRVSVGDML
jgi:hypothetical protein